jgi:aryl-alcohol dehydrogenase-like predicted oxidoreductase
MKQITLGTNGPRIGRIGLGLMGMSAFYTGSNTDEAGSIATIHRALELGVTLLDTAEIYGPYLNEELLGKAIAGRREEAVIATKFGTILHRGDGGRGLDGSRENVRLSIEGSLKRLGTDYIDIYYQHRMDPGTPIEETVGALAELIEEGKLRYYGLSEAAPATIRRAHAVHPVTALQTEVDRPDRAREEAAAERRVRHKADAQLDESDFRRQNPRFEGENLEANIRIVEQVDAVAREIGAKPGQVALAWLLAQGDDIAPIPGTKRVSYLEENVAADELELTADQLKALDDVAAAAGDRYADMSPLNK